MTAFPNFNMALARSTSATNTSNTNYVSAGLAIPIGAGEKLLLTYSLNIQGSGTGGLRFKTAALPQNASARMFMNGNSTAVTAYTVASSTTPATSPGNWNTFAGTGVLFVTLLVANSATAGTVDLQFGPVTNGQTATVHMGSNVVAYKVA
jgi:hypothetical protein